MAKNNAQIKATVLSNLKIELNSIIEREIERAKINVKYESPELSEEYFATNARLTMQKLLLEFSTQMISNIDHTNKLYYTPLN